MKQQISATHKKQFEEMKRHLGVIGVKEGNFIKVELLFYDAINIARTYGDDENENALLAAFKQLQNNQYRQTTVIFKKSTQREQAIRRFNNQLKLLLTAGMKNSFFSPQLSTS